MSDLEKIIPNELLLVNEEMLTFFIHIDEVVNPTIPSIIIKYNSEQLEKLVALLINFVLFISTKQSTLEAKEYFARLAFSMYIYYLKNKLNSKQTGGIPITVNRNGRLIQIDSADMVEGDDVPAVFEGAVQGHQAAVYAGQQLDVRAAGGNVQPPNNEIMEGRDEYDPEVEKLRIMVLEHNKKKVKHALAMEEMMMNIELKQADNLLDIMNGKISRSTHALILASSSATGFACCMSVRTLNQTVYNVGRGVSDVAYDAAGNIVQGAMNITPNAVAAAGHAFYSWGKYADQQLTDFWNYISISSTTTTQLANSVELDPYAVTQEQLTCFETAWKAISGSAERTDVAIGSTCAACCCAGLYYVEQSRVQTAKTVATAGPAFTQMVQNAENIKLNNAADLTLKFLGSGIVGPGPALVANTVNAIRTRPVAAVGEGQAPRQVPAPQQEQGPNEVLLIQQQQQENQGLRQRRPNQNAGKYTKKRGGRSKKTRKNRKQKKK